MDAALDDRADVRHLCAAPAPMLAPAQPGVEIRPFHHYGRGPGRSLQVALKIADEVPKPPFPNLDATER